MENSRTRYKVAVDFSIVTDDPEKATEVVGAIVRDGVLCQPHEWLKQFGVVVIVNIPTKEVNDESTSSTA